MSTVHALFDGRSDDIDTEVLFPDGIPTLPQTTGVLAASNDLAGRFKEALADHYDRSLSEFFNYEIVIEPNGDITLRPPAVFG